MSEFVQHKPEPTPEQPKKEGETIEKKDHVNFSDAAKKRIEDARTEEKTQTGHAKNLAKITKPKGDSVASSGTPEEVPAAVPAGKGTPESKKERHVTPSEELPAPREDRTTETPDTRREEDVRRTPETNTAPNNPRIQQLVSEKGDILVRLRIIQERLKEIGRSEKTPETDAEKSILYTERLNKVNILNTLMDKLERDMDPTDAKLLMEDWISESRAHEQGYKLISKGNLAKGGTAAPNRFRVPASSS